MTLKHEQLEAMEAILYGENVFVALPTELDTERKDF